jgi:hypothetical protein
MMEEGTNISRYATIGLLATIPGLRKTLFWVCLLAVFGGILMAYISVPDRSIAASSNPICNREVLANVSAPDAPAIFGRYVNILSSATNQWNRYVREANGSGWCILRRAHYDAYRYRWYEVPTKYGPIVEQYAKLEPGNKLDAKIAEIGGQAILGWIIAGFSAIVLVFMWLPAALLAMAGRNVIHNLKDEEV